MNDPTGSERAGVTLALLLPHAPILVPAVAGERAADCGATMRAMRRAADRLVAHRPSAVVLLSPHAPRHPAEFGIAQGPLAGSLAAFHAPEVTVAFANDEPLAAAIAQAAAARGVATRGFSGEALDHGSVVPLWYLAAAGWRGPTVILALSRAEHPLVPRLGEAVRAAAESLGGRVTVVASGDMSHALQPGGPAGFHRDGARFDAGFMDRLRAGATRELLEFDPDLRENAAEDVLDSTVFALAACGWQNTGREVLGYEGPFGVGYGVAVLYAAARPAPLLAELGALDLPAIARQSIAEAVRNGSATLPLHLSAPAAPPLGVFVTLHDGAGHLRGCIGTLTPHSGNLAADTWRMAREAAFRDPRFPAVQADELAGLRIDVTVLGPLETAASPAELDPARWGVVVSTPDGRRGVLLPALPGVTTVDEQIAIACGKAGIDPQEAHGLQRFAAERLVEREPGAAVR